MPVSLLRASHSITKVVTTTYFTHSCFYYDFIQTFFFTILLCSNCFYAFPRELYGFPLLARWGNLRVLLEQNCFHW